MPRTSDAPRLRGGRIPKTVTLPVVHGCGHAVRQRTTVPGWLGGRAGTKARLAEFTEWRAQASGQSMPQCPDCRAAGDLAAVAAGEARWAALGLTLPVLDGGTERQQLLARQLRMEQLANVKTTIELDLLGWVQAPPQVFRALLGSTVMDVLFDDALSTVTMHWHNPLLDEDAPYPLVLRLLIWQAAHDAGLTSTSRTRTLLGLLRHSASQRLQRAAHASFARAMVAAATTLAMHDANRDGDPWSDGGFANALTRFSWLMSPADRGAPSPDLGDGPPVTSWAEPIDSQVVMDALSGRPRIRL